MKSNSGDHRQFLHPKKSGKVTVDGKPNDDVPSYLWYSMLRQAGLRK
ncbi:MAG: type II toxin-antitoxin system HicA family toxin [Planctomycetota bacterium]|nr:type II toxin-antitoxin system HicA family toxin [Planctomycetota bacterium]